MAQAVGELQARQSVASDEVNESLLLGRALPPTLVNYASDFVNDDI